MFSPSAWMPHTVRPRARSSSVPTSALTLPQIGVSKMPTDIRHRQLTFAAIFVYAFLGLIIGLAVASL
jgi:hypothetical protein